VTDFPTSSREKVSHAATNQDRQAQEMLRQFSCASRPLVLLGAGAGLAGAATSVQDWCEAHGLPFVSSWGGMPYLRRGSKNYLGSIGVYGSRFANWAVQSADSILVFGSRLDNRQRTSDPRAFAPFAAIHVVDIDHEELKKYGSLPNYRTYEYDLRDVARLLQVADFAAPDIAAWLNAISSCRSEHDTGWESACEVEQINPYKAVEILEKKFDVDAIVVADCGANLCWVYQSLGEHPGPIFTAGGNSPMGYSLPAAIGAALTNQARQVICFIGDGGLQMNIQELQTVSHYRLNIQLIVMNNQGYGIIKQFQDSNFGGRHFASGIGYSTPDFEKIAFAYDIEYKRVTTVQELEGIVLQDSAQILDLCLDPDTLICPKVEMNRFLHDQFPYLNDCASIPFGFDYPSRPSDL